MEFRIKTLTPVWTGGIETGKMDRIHETGIIGSLRWWYEAILRGLGADVCNPTADSPQDRCQFDSETYQKFLRDGHNIKEALQTGLQDVCPICRLFGCTGWKRRFELIVDVSPNQLTPLWLATLNQSEQFNHWWLSQIFKTCNNKVIFGDITLKARFRYGYESYQEVLKALLSFMAEYSALGSKVQYGFGQFIYPEAYQNNQNIQILRNHITTPTNTKNLQSNFYSLRDFWCLKGEIPCDDKQIKKFQKANAIGDKQNFEKYRNVCLPVSFDIRYKLPVSENKGLRQNYRLAHGKEKTRQVFGTVQSEEKKWGSRIFVSHLYKRELTDNDYQLRVWGFTNSQVLQEIQGALKQMFSTIKFTTTIGQTVLNMEEDLS